MHFPNYRQVFYFTMFLTFKKVSQYPRPCCYRLQRHKFLGDVTYINPFCTVSISWNKIEIHATLSVRYDFAFASPVYDEPSLINRSISVVVREQITCAREPENLQRIVAGQHSRNLSAHLPFWSPEHEGLRCLTSSGAVPEK